MSTYIKKQDYERQIQLDNLEQILGENGSVKLDDAEFLAQAELKSYLNARYDMDEEFKKTPPASGNKDKRNPQVVSWIIDIALYHLHSRINPRNIPELRLIRYDGNDPKQTGGAIGALKMAAKGSITLDLPEYEDDEKSTGLLYGSDNDFEVRPFNGRRRSVLGERRLVKTNYNRKK